MTLTAQWSNKTFQPQDQDQVLGLLRASMGPGSHGARQAVWEWKHLRNPFGPSLVRLASDRDGEVIGLRAMMQWQFSLGERKLRAVRAVDTATHPTARRLGIFSTLTRSVIEDAQRGGVDFIFNTPNQYSMPGYLKMGWQSVGVAKPLVHILNPGRFVIGMTRHVSGLRGAAAHTEDSFIKRPVTRIAEFLHSEQSIAQLEELLHRSRLISSDTASVTTDLSVDFLRWRYAQHPYIPYYAVTVEKGGRLDALAIFRTNTRFGLREVVLTELFLADADEKLGKAIVREVKSLVRADYLVAYFREGSAPRRAIGSSGFHQMPKGGVAVTARRLEQDLPFDPFDLNNWQFSLGDLELF